jgi:AcrR family transcriptional regulator
MNMQTTKERIMLAALRLFAKDGYEAVSVSAIAGQLGMTKGALYKHYTNKRDIFDSIVNRMKEKDMEHAAKFDVPAGAFEEMAEADRAVTFQKIKAFSVAMFRHWTEDEFTSCFRKMLTLEQYRNPEMADFLNRYLTGGVVGYAKDLIHEASVGLGGYDKDPEILAMEYFAPIYMMMNLYDEKENKEVVVSMVEKHIDYFMETLK